MAVWSETNVREISDHKRIDGEFFHPKYISSEEAVRTVDNVTQLGNIGNFLIGPFGSAFHVSNYDPNSDYRYIRGKDVKPFQLLDDDNVYMPERDFIRLIKYEVLPDDLLISVVGTLGNVAIVPENVKGIFSCKSTVFRNSSVNAHYLLAYLNSSYGRDCLLRRQRGAIQTGLNLEDLGTIPIPLFNDDIHEEIGDKVKEALYLSRQSNSIYSQAQQLLENELGLDKLVLDNPQNYETKFSDVLRRKRGDAEFYNPQLRSYYNQLSRKYKLVKITEMAGVFKFSNPDYANEGFPIITQKHLETINPENYGIEPIASDEWVEKNPAAVLQKDDLLFYSVGAYLGKTNIWFNDDKAVPASFITLLRTQCKAEAGYLMVLLNSQFGILQSKVFQSGTSQQYIYPKDIKNFLVPDIENEIKQELYDLVLQSYNARKESQQLLEQTIKQIEDLIEGALQK